MLSWLRPVHKSSNNGFALVIYILTRRLPQNLFELWVSLSIFCVIIRNPAKSIYLKNIPQPSAFFPIAVLITVFIGCVFFTVVFEVFVCFWPQFGLNLRQESKGTDKKYHPAPYIIDLKSNLIESKSIILHFQDWVRKLDQNNILGYRGCPRPKIAGSAENSPLYSSLGS